MQASSASSSIQAAVNEGATVLRIGSEQTDLEADGLSALEAHTDFPDVPFARIDLPRVSMVPAPDADQDKQAFAEEEERIDVNRPPPEWCVDLGTSMLAMTTFELWMALARGDVEGKTSVWCNGMESWEMVANVPELAHALSDSLSLAPPPVIPTPTELMSVRSHDRTPLGFGTTDAANDGQDDEPAQSGPISRRMKGFSGGRAAFAAACFAAAAAVGLVAVPQSSDVPDEAASANRPVATARLQGAMDRANRQVEEALQRRIEAEAARAVEPVPLSARKHKEVGQRRSRRGRH